MRIAVCDDEPEILNDIERKIHRLYPEMEVFLYEDGQTLPDAKIAFDILFLDIRMEGRDGMETARALRGTGSRAVIIFVTALEEYVYDAFDVGAFHYLVKPLDGAKFFNVLKKAVEECKNAGTETMSAETGIMIKHGAVTERILFSEIYYLEVFNRKIVLHRKDDTIEFYGKMKELEESLGNDFMRTHRAYLVNLRHVRKYNAAQVTLENGQTVLLAKQKYAQFVKQYMHFVRRETGGEETADE